MQDHRDVRRDDQHEDDAQKDDELKIAADIIDLFTRLRLRSAASDSLRGITGTHVKILADVVE